MSRRELIQKDTQMTRADLSIWIEIRGLSMRAAARALDITENRLKRLLAGEVRIPVHIGLACAALSHPIPPWRAPHDLV